MAYSNITKQALASALKQLLDETSFKKISVADICNKCDMNRKSFYYHFRDKYDLANWIFDTEMIALLQNRQPEDRWDVISRTCQYLYDNRDFYYKVFQIEGQNSLREHCREFLLSLLQDRMEELIGYEDIHQICVNFFADGIVCAILRWLLNKDCIPPEQFTAIIRNMVERATITIYRDMKSE